MAINEQISVGPFPCFDRIKRIVSLRFPHGNCNLGKCSSINTSIFMSNNHLSVFIVENPNKDISYEISRFISSRLSCQRTEISVSPVVDAIYFPRRSVDGVAVGTEH